MYGSDLLGFQVSASLFLGQEILPSTRCDSLGGTRRIGYEGPRMSQTGRGGSSIRTAAKIHQHSYKRENNKL